MKKLVIASLGVAALVATTAGMAGAAEQAPSAAARSGFYLTGLAGYGKTDLVVLGAAKQRNKNFTWNVGGGYQFNQYIAVEGGYMRLAKVNLSSFGAKDLKTGGVFADAKVMYPVTEKADVFAKGGAALMLLSDANKATIAGNNHTLVGLVGAGADYYVTNNVAVTGEGLVTFKHANFPGSYSGLVGLTYKF